MSPSTTTPRISVSATSPRSSPSARLVGGRLKPLSMSARVSLLRSHGILQIDREESADIEKLQTSRANESGCNCVGSCLPETCSCFINQVECEVDSEGFPCKCDLIQIVTILWAEDSSTEKKLTCTGGTKLTQTHQILVNFLNNETPRGSKVCSSIFVL